MAKVTHSREPQSLKKESKSFLPRSDEKYTRIEQYDDVNFLNSLMFEFYLRIKEFAELYNSYDNLLKNAVDTSDNLSNLQSVYIQCCNIEEENKSFEKFGYDSLEMIEFIYGHYNSKKAPYDKWQYVDGLVHTLSLETDDVLLAHGIDPTVPILLDCRKLEEKKLATSLEFKYYHPTYKASDYTMFDICVDFNALEGKEIAKERINTLIDGFYARFDNVGSVFIYNKVLEKIRLEKHNKMLKTYKDVIRNKDNKLHFANYFYVYDQKKNDIFNEDIIMSISNYYEQIGKIKKVSQNQKVKVEHYSLSTLKTDHNKIKKLIEQQEFNEFYHHMKTSKEIIDLDRD